MAARRFDGTLALRTANVGHRSISRTLKTASTRKPTITSRNRTTVTYTPAIMASSFLASLYYRFSYRQATSLSQSTSSTSGNKHLALLTNATPSTKHEYTSWSVMLKACLEDSERLEVEREINNIIRSASGDQLAGTVGETAPISHRDLDLEFPLLWLRVPCASENETAAKICKLRAVKNIEKSPEMSFAKSQIDAADRFQDKDLNWHRFLICGEAVPLLCTTRQTETLMFVVDTPINAKHPEFGPRQVLVLDQEKGNLIAHNVQTEGSGSSTCVPATPRNPLCGQMSTADHGTFVASLIAGRNVGIAPGHEIISVPLPIDRFSAEDVGKALDAIHTYLCARQKAGKPTRSIINLSLGCGATHRLDQRIDKLLPLSVSIIGASGNNYCAAQDRFPSCHESVLVVGCIDRHYNEAAFSNFGHRVDVFAPGEDVLGAYTNSGRPDYTTGDGTSFASPIVCGVALQYLSRSPNPLDRSLKDIVKGLGYTNKTRVNLYSDRQDPSRQQLRDNAIAPPLAQLKNNL